MAENPVLDCIKGCWEVVEVLVDGKASPQRHRTIIVYEDDVTWWTIPDMTESKLFRFKINTDCNPYQIDVFGDEAGVAYGIFKIDGDLLTECSSEPGHEIRPETFRSTSTNNCHITVARKIDKEFQRKTGEEGGIIGEIR